MQRHALLSDQLSYPTSRDAIAHKKANFCLRPASSFFFLYGLMLNVTCQRGLVSPNDTPPVSGFTSIKYAAMLPAIQTEANTKYNHFSVIGMFNYRLNSPQKC